MSLASLTTENDHQKMPVSLYNLPSKEHDTFVDIYSVTRWLLIIWCFKRNLAIFWDWEGIKLQPLLWQVKDAGSPPIDLLLDKHYDRTINCQELYFVQWKIHLSCIYSLNLKQLQAFCTLDILISFSVIPWMTEPHVSISWQIHLFCMGWRKLWE